VRTGEYSHDFFATVVFSSYRVVPKGKIVNRIATVASTFLLLLLGCVEAHSQGYLGRRLVTIQVEINNVAGRFLIDTGANCTIIDSLFAQRLGLKPSGTASLERAYSLEQISTVSAEHVRVGPKVWSDVSLVMLDLGTLSRIQTTPISGVLGADLLATMKVRLSYSSGTAQVIDDIGGGAFPIALKKARSRYFVPITIGSSTFELLLDSGTNISALSAFAWRTLPALRRPNDVIEGVVSSENPGGSLIVCLPVLHLGDKSVGETVLREHPLRIVTPPQSGSFSDTAFAGILGGDILERFEVTLDLQHAVMYLNPDSNFRMNPYEFATVGIQFLKTSLNAFSVVAVWKNSPAEATGVIVGDRILSINGHSSKDLGVEAFTNQLHGAPGTPIVIEVERAPRKFLLHMNTRQLVCKSPAN
jgi:Aspartyl protease/PDZ domain